MELTKPIKFKDKTINMTMEEVCVKFKGLIFKILQSWKGQYEIDDLQQIGYIGLINAYNTYNSENGCYFLNYAYTVISREFLRNRANNKNKNIIIESLNNKVSKNSESEDEKIDLLKDNNINIEKSVINNCQRSLIQNILNSLSDKDRKVIQLYYFENKPMREVAEIIGYASRTVVLKRIKVISNKLKNELIKYDLKNDCLI